MHETDKDKIAQIVNTLTKELPSHQYLISRKEAKQRLGLKIKEPSPKLEELIWKLYRGYEEWLQLNVPYSAEAILGTGASASVNFDRAVIESLKPDGKLRTHVFRTDREISRVQRNQPGVPFPIVGIQERNISDRWLEVEI